MASNRWKWCRKSYEPSSLLLATPSPVTQLRRRRSAGRQDTRNNLPGHEAVLPRSLATAYAARLTDLFRLPGDKGHVDGLGASDL